MLTEGSHAMSLGHAELRNVNDFRRYPCRLYLAKSDALAHPETRKHWEQAHAESKARFQELALFELNQLGHKSRRTGFDTL